MDKSDRFRTKYKFVDLKMACQSVKVFGVKELDRQTKYRTLVKTKASLVLK